MAEELPAPPDEHRTPRPIPVRPAVPPLVLIDSGFSFLRRKDDPPEPPTPQSDSSSPSAPVRPTPPPLRFV